MTSPSHWANAKPRPWRPPQPVAPFVPDKFRDTCGAKEALQRDFTHKHVPSVKLTDLPVISSDEFEAINARIKATTRPVRRTEIRDYLPEGVEIPTLRAEAERRSPKSPKRTPSPRAPPRDLPPNASSAVQHYFQDRDRYRSAEEFFGQRLLESAELPVRRYFAQLPEDRAQHALGSDAEEDRAEPDSPLAAQRRRTSP